jgi:hypothetical protein
MFYDAVRAGEDAVAMQAAYQKFESARDACSTAYDYLLKETSAIEKYREDIERLANVIDTLYYENMIGDKDFYNTRGYGGRKHLPRSYFLLPSYTLLSGGCKKKTRKSLKRSYNFAKRGSQQLRR